MSQYYTVIQYSLRYSYTDHRLKAAQLRSLGHERNCKLLFSPVEISEVDTAAFCIDLHIPYVNQTT